MRQRFLVTLIEDIQWIIIFSFCYWGVASSTWSDHVSEEWSSTLVQDWFVYLLYWRVGTKLYFYSSGLAINLKFSSRLSWWMQLRHQSNCLVGLWVLKIAIGFNFFKFAIIFWYYPIVGMGNQCHLCIFGIWNLGLLSELANVYNLGVPNPYSSYNRLNFSQKSLLKTPHGYFE